MGHGHCPLKRQQKSCMLFRYNFMNFTKLSVEFVCLLIMKLELCNFEKKLSTPYPFHTNFDDTYQITV